METCPPLNPFILKVASRCNLDCSYCYMYHGNDTGWRSRPRFMSDEVFDAVLLRIGRHCALSGQSEVHLIFHGGEPTLLGAERFDRLCTRARAVLSGLDVEIGIQTNGTRLTPAWAEMFVKHGVEPNVSMDGPPDVHDRFRVDHQGRGSYRAVLAGITELKKAGIPFGIYTVIQPGADGLRVHEHFEELSCTSVSYLWPALTHDNAAEVFATYGPTPIADYLIPIFDHWWERGGVPRVREFWNILRLMLGGTSRNDVFGNLPLTFVAIDSDGSIQGLDKLRMCEDGLINTGLNVEDDDFSALSGIPVHSELMLASPLPTACGQCEERTTCAGGYLPHRYSSARGFDNRSVWCADIIRLFEHIRDRTGIGVRETLERRAALTRAGVGAVLTGQEG